MAWDTAASNGLKNNINLYYIKYSALYGFRALIKLIVSHVRLFMIISHEKIIAFQTITNHSFWTFCIGGKPVVYIINRKIHGCFEIPDLFLVLNMILVFLTRSRTRNKSGVSAHHLLFSI